MTSSADESISVVIPTLGRPQLASALLSCAEQVTSTILVVDDPAQEHAVREIVTSSAPHANVIVRSTTGRIGGGAARQVGLELAETDYVAFLDDDDTWESDRITRLRPLLRRDVEQFLTGSVHFHFRSGEIRTLPVDPPPLDASAALSLALQRKHLRYNEGFVQSSSFVVTRSLALRHGWRAGLKKHQDWDFFARATADPAATWVHDAAPRVDVHQGSEGSVSKQAIWQSSYDWVTGIPGLTPRAQADFSACHILRAGLQNRDRAAIAAAGRLMLSAKRAPHAASLVLGLSGIQQGLRRAS